jgi:hypothetical protein
MDRQIIHGAEPGAPAVKRERSRRFPPEILRFSGKKEPKRRDREGSRRHAVGNAPPDPSPVPSSSKSPPLPPPAPRSAYKHRPLALDPPVRRVPTGHRGRSLTPPRYIQCSPTALLIPAPESFLESRLPRRNLFELFSYLLLALCFFCLEDLRISRLID